MGFSWAPFLAQTANQYQMGRSIPGGSSYLTDRGDAWVVNSEQSRIAHYVYIDNLGSLGIDPEKVRKNLDSTTQHLNNIGLDIHEIRGASSSGEALGICVDGGRRLTRNTWQIFLYLYFGLTGVLERRRVCGWVVEVMLGHCAHFSLVNRDLMCIFSACYAFVYSAYSAPTLLWETAREDIRCFRSLMIFCYADWALKWSPLVYCVDASLTGYGIVQSRWDAQNLKKVGRVSERTRYRLNGEAARWSALSAAGFRLNDLGKIEYPLNFVNEEVWEKNSDFPEVPWELWGQTSWTHVMAGAWTFEDDILLLEARALAKAAARAGNCLPADGSRILMLGDSLGVILACSRRRAHNFKLMSHIRRVVAIGPARNIKFIFRWIPSELNNADESSRQYDAPTSKVVTHHIDARLAHFSNPRINR